MNFQPEKNNITDFINATLSNIGSKINNFFLKKPLKGTKDNMLATLAIIIRGFF